MTFKEKYEALNLRGERPLKIPEDNTISEIKGSTVVKMIENGETFYLYIGDEKCPWCRSVIEKFLEIAKAAKVNHVFYIKIWGYERSEIFRDHYSVVNGRLIADKPGSDAYYKLLKYFDPVLPEYIVSDEKGNIYNVNEKRIGVPCFFYVENGKLKRYTTGVSPLQLNANEELSEEILNDEEEQFRVFFDLD